MTDLPEVASLDSNRLSTFRTRHKFQHYAKFTTIEGYVALLEFAAREGLQAYVLGNGSNTLFCTSSGIPPPVSVIVIWALSSA